MPSTHPARLKFLDRVNYFGQIAEFDSQGRVVIHAAAARSGRHGGRGRRARAVRLPRRLEPRAVRREAPAASRSPTTTRGRSRSSGSDAMLPRRRCWSAEVVALLAPARGGVFVDCTVGLGGHTRGAARGGRGAGDRARSRRGRAAHRARSGSPGSAIASSSCTPTTASCARGARRARHRAASTACSPTSACRRCSSTTPAAASASGATGRSTCAWIARRGRPLADLLATSTKTTLADVIFEFGEERHSRRVARAIVARAASAAS